MFFLSHLAMVPTTRAQNSHGGYPCNPLASPPAPLNIGLVLSALKLLGHDTLRRDDVNHSSPPAERVAIYRRQQALRHSLKKLVLVLEHEAQPHNGRVPYHETNDRRERVRDRSIEVAE